MTFKLSDLNQKARRFLESGISLHQLQSDGLECVEIDVSLDRIMGTTTWSLKGDCSRVKGIARDIDYSALMDGINKPVA